MSSISFRASARTIDHLGKGQIADTPTAVSELWKNSYDAYARNVALHLFDGKMQCAAVIDNGCGMTLNQVINSWLVIGTNAKTSKLELPDEDRFGLPLRKTQGEKGIGRLSAAFLAPVAFLVTKKANSDFTAVLVDWRLFENPYLSLSDINVPFESFDDIDSMNEVCSRLVDQLRENLCLDCDLKTEKEIDLIEREVEKIEKYEQRLAGKDEVNRLRIRASWHRLALEEMQTKSGDTEQSTELEIKNFCENFKFNERCTHTWRELLNEVETLDKKSHGTGLFLFDIGRELSLLTNRGDKAADHFEIKSVRESLQDTLKAFTDPFEKNKYHFVYEIKSYSIDWEEDVILNDYDEFNYEYFELLEHKVDGEIDEKGWFIGKVTAFGEDLGEVKYPPSIGFDSGKTQVGKFRIRLGAIEQTGEKGLTVLDDTTHEFLSNKIDQDHGILIFRDGLRVLPYGRTDNDFFSIEERRGKSAGRHFWANRRMIGQISLDQINNKNLKDKAGREGFIKNQAARELREIVISHLINFADKHFGGYSDERKIRLSIVNKEKEVQKAAQKKAKSQSQESFKSSLRDQRPVLEAKLAKARELYDELENDTQRSLQKLDQLSQLSLELESLRGELRTPNKPSKINEKLEQSYRQYRDLYNEFSELLKVSQERINYFEATLATKTPFEIAKKYFQSKQGLLNKQVSKFENLIVNKLKKLELDWKRDSAKDRSKYHNEAISILEGKIDAQNLETQLNSLEAIYLELADTNTIKYESTLRALDRLEKGINLDSAFSMAEEERTFYEDKAKKLQALAQLGISVEVIGHELEQQDQLVLRGLNSLPADVKEHPGFKTALNAHRQLTAQIRFLSPMKLSGYQARQEITGGMIYEHIKKFFRDRFERQRVEFAVSEEFKNIMVRDLPSRIYPVFINLINNAMYWVCLSDERKISINFLDGLVVIGNSGPPVDQEDIPRLFEIFYSRRTNGNGVGLYLCKENLKVANHKIWYGQLSEEKIYADGANFVIEFNGQERKG